MVQEPGRRCIVECVFVRTSCIVKQSLSNCICCAALKTDGLPILLERIRFGSDARRTKSSNRGMLYRGSCHSLHSEVSTQELNYTHCTLFLRHHLHSAAPSSVYVDEHEQRC